MANTKPLASQVKYKTETVYSALNRVESDITINANNNVRKDDYTQLRAYTGTGTVVDVIGQRIAGRFVYDSSDTTTPDNNGTVIVGSDGRRWKRITNGIIHVGWFGAKGDGTDETAKLQAALDSAGYSWVTGGSNQYTVKSLLLNNNQRIQTLLLKTLAGSEDFVSPITIDGRTVAKTNIQLYDVRIDGNRQNQSLIVSATEDGGRCGFRILGKVSKLYIKNCIANYCGTDGLEFFSYVVPWPAFTDIIVENCEFNWNRRHGGAIDSTNGVKIIDTVFNSNGLDLNTTDPETHGNRGSRQLGSLYGNGFDAESYGAGTHCVDLGFVNCNMLGNARSGLLVLPNGQDYGTPNWKPYAQIYIEGGRYDAGTETYSGKSPITFTALNLTSAQRAFTDIVVDGANCAIGGPTLKYVKSARIRCQAVELDAAGFHAGVIDSDDVEMDLGLVTRPPVVYVANANVSLAYPFTGKSTPTLTAFQGCTVSNIVVEKISSSIYTGETFKITGKITQTATGSAGWMAIGAGGRTLLDAKIYALNPNNGLPSITGFNPAGYLGINSGTVATHDFVATITLR